MRHLPFFFVMVLSLFLLSCNQNRYYAFSGYAQGGTYQVKYNSKDVKQGPSEVRDSVEKILKNIDNSISGYNKSSLLSRFNAGENVEKDDIFRELDSLSNHFCSLSGGAFDAYACPVFDIWGFGFTTDSLPSRELVNRALEESKLHKKANFNAIAQGFSCDLVARYLKSIGVKDMLVDIGEIYCCGLNPSSKGWTIGIDKPFDGNDAPGKDVEAIWSSEGRSCGIVTSGNYRKFYIKDGKKYSHTIDPRTGYPVSHNLLSATIVAPTAAQADAMATICMVLGPDQAKAFIQADPELEGCLILQDSIWVSAGFTLKK